MTYLQFREQWHRVGCFNVYQVKAWYPDFDRNNYRRWIQKGFIIRLRQDWYAFADLIQTPDFARVIASRMYGPSYISLHTALSYYGIIPAAVVRITSITTNRKCVIQNAFGDYSYQTLKSELFWGYMPKTTEHGAFLLASAEKAILDLLYLYPEYCDEESLLNLRLDEDWMQEDLDAHRLLEFAQRAGSKALKQRVELLLKIYS